MSGRPKISGTFEVDQITLSLDNEQLGRVASRLGIEVARLKSGGPKPPDGQELVVTHKGKYVRIRYEAGGVKITPEEPHTP
jgi:hypothetical protein